MAFGNGASAGSAAEPAAVVALPVEHAETSSAATARRAPLVVRALWVRALRLRGPRVLGLGPGESVWSAAVLGRELRLMNITRA
jgi:hypothetical protein